MVRLLMWLPSRLWTLWKWRGLFREGLRGVQAAAEWIADELESNARQMRVPRYVQDFSLAIPSYMRFDAWEKHGPTLHALSKPYPELWDEVRLLYQELQGPEGHLVPPERLDEVAARLRETMRSVRRL